MVQQGSDIVQGTSEILYTANPLSLVLSIFFDIVYCQANVSKAESSGYHYHYKHLFKIDETKSLLNFRNVKTKNSQWKRKIYIPIFFF